MKKRDKRKSQAAALAQGMGIDAILAQLASMKDNARSFIDGKDPEADAIWQADVEACEDATDILTALQDEGIKDPEQVRDLIHDYNALAEQYRKMRQRYEEPEAVRRLGAAYLCPDCKHQSRPTAPYCWYCGKRLGWG